MEKADPHPSPAVAISHLTVAKGGATMLSDVSASIGRGAKVVLKGASGSGKSTLLQAIMGFVPFSGSLRLFGTAVQPGTIQALRLRTAYVGQQTAIGQERVSAYVAEILLCSRDPERPPQPASAAALSAARQLLQAATPA
jgi:ABC-type transport system involved in cytochrome bd biosynthesis fused ATPase/permease subunit